MFRAARLNGVDFYSALGFRSRSSAAPGREQDSRRRSISIPATGDTRKPLLLVNRSRRCDYARGSTPRSIFDIFVEEDCGVAIFIRRQGDLEARRDQSACAQDGGENEAGSFVTQLCAHAAGAAR